MNVNISLFAKLTRRIFVVLNTLAASLPLYAANNPPAQHDHVELEAALVAPYASARLTDARTFTFK